MIRKPVLVVLFPISILIGIFLFFGIKGNIQRKRFYRNASGSEVIDSSAWQFRTIDYYLEDGLQIDARASHRDGKIDVNVGDSMTKEANSWEFDIYKKSDMGKYQFFRRYNLTTDF